VKIVTVAQMRELERRAIEAGVAEDALMEAAGLAVARRVGQGLDGIRGKRVVVLVGPGNNGGDGLVAARFLADWGALVTLYVAGPARRQDKFAECTARRIRVVEAAEDPDHWQLGSYVPLADAVVDALLGIGARLPLEGTMRSLLLALRKIRNEHPALGVYAVDVPTGIDADTGAADEACCPATVTLALGAPKAGLLRFPAAAWAGTVETLPIGIPERLDAGVSLELIDEPLAAPLVPTRALDGHKGTFGEVLVVGGSRSFVGAPVLAAGAAYRSGAGLVRLAAPEGVSRIAAGRLLEQVHLPLAESALGTVAPEAAGPVRAALEETGAGVIGPGLADTEPSGRFVEALLLSGPPRTVPVVIDADALNALARVPGWADRLAFPAVLTPHPGELARLLRSTVAEVQADRLAAALEAARTFGQVVVLKGAHTVVALPSGRAAVSPFANPALATAGTGDVLAGIIGALAAQGASPFGAAVAGVLAHARAAEVISAGWGSAGLMASDLLEEIPPVLRTLRERG
jgi:hydroxyethylthiazole kinase-like uncharacterized protein yjeF